jgi:hypothetical protein
MRVGVSDWNLLFGRFNKRALLWRREGDKDETKHGARQQSGNVVQDKNENFIDRLVRPIHPPAGSRWRR